MESRKCQQKIVGEKHRQISFHSSARCPSGRTKEEEKILCGSLFLMFSELGAAVLDADPDKIVLRNLGKLAKAESIGFGLKIFQGNLPVQQVYLGTATTTHVYLLTSNKSGLQMICHQKAEAARPNSVTHRKKIFEMKTSANM